MTAREQHWKEFCADTFWKKIIAAPKSTHHVYHVDIVFLHPAAYSDI